MKIEQALSLRESGALKQMYISGFLSIKMLDYIDIYLWVDAQIKTRGISKRQSVLEASVMFSKDERTIWRAVRCFAN